MFFPKSSLTLSLLEYVRVKIFVCAPLAASTLARAYSRGLTSPAIIGELTRRVAKGVPYQILVRRRSNLENILLQSNDHTCNLLSALSLSIAVQ